MARPTRPIIAISQGLSVMVGLPIIPTWDSASRPKKGKAGIFGFNTETNQLEYWNGKAWFEAAMDEG